MSLLYLLMRSDFAHSNLRERASAVQNLAKLDRRRVVHARGGAACQCGLAALASEPLSKTMNARLEHGNLYKKKPVG
jgi:hypothetical protein